MILASQLRHGAVLKMPDGLFRVIESTYHIGQGKMPGSVHAKVQHVQKGTFKEIRWRPEERLDEAALEKKLMTFLYSDADAATFMDPVSYDQVSIPLEAIGPAQKFLRAEMEIAVEFFEGQPISVVFPPATEVKVATTAQPVHQQQDNTYKFATLENGMEVMVPQFIRPGEIVRIEVATGKYLDRVRTDIKRV
jgi:elongation factor P